MKIHRWLPCALPALLVAACATGAAPSSPPSSPVPAPTPPVQGGASSHASQPSSPAGAAAAPKPAAPAGAAGIDTRAVSEWEVFTPPDKKFSLRLPGKPEIEHGGDTVTYIVRVGRDVKYYATFWPSEEDAAFHLGMTPATFVEKLRDSAVEAFATAGGARLVESHRDYLYGNAYIVYLTEATPKNFPRTLIRSMILNLNKGGVVTVNYGAPAEDFDKGRAKQYFESFALPIKDGIAKQTVRGLG